MIGDYDEFDGPSDDGDDPGIYDDEPDADTLPCPECGASIYEDAVRCPVCGTYVTFRTSPWSGRPVWWVLLGLLGLVATAIVLARLLP